MSTYKYEKGKNSDKIFEATIKIKFKYDGQLKDLAKEVAHMTLLEKNTVYEWEDNEFDVLSSEINVNELKNENNNSRK